MIAGMKRLRCTLLLAVTVGLTGTGCGPSIAVPKPAAKAPAASAPQASTGASASAGPPLGLWTGTVPPDVLKPVATTVLERGVVGDTELLLVGLAANWREGLGHSADSAFAAQTPGWVSVSGENGLSGVFQSASPGSSDVDRVWLRRRAADSGKTLSAAMFFGEPSRHAENVPGAMIPLDVSPGDTPKAMPGLERRFTSALSGFIAQRRDLPFRDFALARLATIASPGSAWPAALSPGTTDWPDLMELFSGERSVEAALQTRSQLRSEVDKFRPSISISELRPPAVVRHPWKEMLKILGSTVPAEPLANVVPADFYYVRANNIGALLELIDEVDAWGTPAMHLIKGRTEQVDMLKRYRTQLGLSGSELSRLLGPELIEQLVLTGSDPFLRQGSDVTLVFKPRNGRLLLAGLEQDLAETATAHGVLSRTESSIPGAATLSHAVTANGRVNRWLTSYKDWVIVSNSETAVRRIVQVMDGKAPALSDEDDFRYMLARDSREVEQVLAYAGDRFMESIVSPRSRLLDARRQIALAELQRPGFAALLHGWVHGSAPATLAELQKSRLLTTDDQRHFDGQPIQFAPGDAPCSAWGSPRSLVPVLDLPDLAKVTTTEKRAYESFVGRYEGLWATALDPIAFRLRAEKNKERHAISATMRVLPLVRDSDYSQVAELAGKQRISEGRNPGGARVIFAIAPDSELRRELTRSSRGLLGRELKLDWLGAWGMIGILDAPALLTAAQRAGYAPEPRTDAEWRPDELAAITSSPVYAALGVKNKAAALLVLTVLKAQFGEGLASFSTHSRHRETIVTEVNIEGEVKFYYALTARALYVAFLPETLNTLLDLDARGETPAAARGASGPGQFVWDMHAQEGGALTQVLSWAFEAQARHRVPGDTAEMLLLGAPGSAGTAAGYREISLNYLGSIPFTQDGKMFELRASGVADPVRGSAFERTWPKLPVPGSPVPKVLAAVSRLTSRLGFDEEPSPAGGAVQRSLVIDLKVGGR